MVCQDCSRYGVVLPQKKQLTLKLKKKAVPYSKDVFIEMDKVLVPEWGKRIRMMREKKGMSREELGAKVGEKTITIAKIENEELRPPDKTIEKLEKALGVTLFRIVEQGVVKHKEVKPFTLGDLPKNAKWSEKGCWTAE